jgi:hypothetical protein
MNKIENLMRNKRNHFDPSFSDDMRVAKEYFMNNKWTEKGCPFFLEWPYLDVPSMLKDKITKHSLGLL